MIYPRVRDHIELEELIALANAGLAEAAARYEPDRGAAFTTFAWYRVHGAILDGLRRSSNLPRRVWAKLEAGAAKAGAPPVSRTDALAQVKSALSAIRTMYVTSLEALQDAGFDR